MTASRDLVAIAEEVFHDLLPGGADWVAALVRHNGDMGIHGACDRSCGLDDCRRPYFDEAGLTRYRDAPEPIEALPERRAS